MGNRASPIVAFGFQLGDETELVEEIEGFAALIEASDNMEDSDWPVELISHGYHDYRYWFLSVRGTSDNGGDWGSVLDVPSEPPQGAMIAIAKAWCEERRITWQEPKWSAMATYS